MSFNDNRARMPDLIKFTVYLKNEEPDERLSYWRYSASKTLAVCRLLCRLQVISGATMKMVK